LIATGGFNKTVGYDFISQLGHTIVPPNPSLFTFNLPKNPILELQGLVAQAEVKILGSKFKDQGMSGPAILKLSSWAARFLNEKNYEFDFMVNWLPHSDENELKELFESYKQNFGSKKAINQFEVDLPKKLKFFLLQKAGINNEIKWVEVTKKQINKLIQALIADVYSSKGKTTFKQEFVNCGGVKLNEVNFKTMESKTVPRLYFAGEVLDIDALTGGFNFQSAWTTAWIAAQSIGK